VYYIASVSHTITEDGGGTAPRGTYPPYIHFTLQKTNRDTQDALGHLSRLLHVNIKDLSVAGTKDKRAVTVQRVSLKRGRKTVEDVWKLVNGQSGNRSSENALKQRGERGIRIADMNYRKSALELGMLKGNAFLITLR
jgi:tRNA pseudouridine13 synthase